MRRNNGGAFFHPVTHELVPAGAFYPGAAHQEHENEAVASEVQVKEPETPGPPLPALTSTKKK